MPGISMDPTANEAFVKAEEADDDDFAIEDSEDDGNTGRRGEYRSRKKLRQPNVVLRSLAYLINGLETGKIDVDPEYQREVVWTADRMTSLINSLMENFYIPPIILNRKAKASVASLVCVDGKQRLSSVRAFVTGMIPCHDHRGDKWFFCEHPHGRTRKVLTEIQKKEFLAKEFCSFEYDSLSEEQEEDLFARVQMGMQLTAAEKMRAQSGAWQELGRLFVQDFPTVFQLLKDRTRAKDFQMALSCFSQILEVQYPTNPDGIPILKTNHTALPKLLQNQAAVDDRLKSHLASVFNTFKELIDRDHTVFTNTERKLKGTQTFAPIEMVAVAVLISVYSETRNNGLLLGDVSYLRILIRQYFTDLRMNQPTWKFVWEYIDTLEQARGTVDGTTIDRAVIPSRVPSQAEPTHPRPPPPTRGRSSASTATVPSSLPSHHKRTRISVSPDTPSTALVVPQHHGLPHKGTNTDRQRPKKQRSSLLPTPNALAEPANLMESHNTTLNPEEVRQKRIAELDSFRLNESNLHVPEPSGMYTKFRMAPVMHSSKSANPMVSNFQETSSVEMVHRSPIKQEVNAPSYHPQIVEKPSKRSVKASGSIPSAYPSTISVVDTHHPTDTGVKSSRSRTLQQLTSLSQSASQYDGAIDLTSDTELEEQRQNLLTSFRRSNKPSSTDNVTSLPEAHVPRSLAPGFDRRAGNAKDNPVAIEDDMNPEIIFGNAKMPKNIVEPSNTNPYKRSH